MTSHPLDYYQTLYDTLEYEPSRLWLIKASATLVSARASEYRSVERACGIPWQIVGALHLMESSCDVTCNLYNGQPLDQETDIEPIGLGPWTSWEAMAEGWGIWTVKRFFLGCLPPRAGIARWLRFAEQYNGMGYARRGINSPYLWSGSRHYTGGKYVGESEGIPAHFDYHAVSDQIGVGVVIKWLGGLTP